MRRLLVLACLLVPTLARAWSIIPIPEFITDPNEGNTYGILPVVLFTDEEDRIKYMLAPDFSYNDTKGFFPRLRFFGYPSRTRQYALVAGNPSAVAKRSYSARLARVRSSRAGISLAPLKTSESTTATLTKTTPWKCPGTILRSVSSAWRPRPP